MKIATYVLNFDGTVPDFVIDGGYFASATDVPSPQDWTLVGFVTDDAPIDKFTSLKDFVVYLESIGAESWTEFGIAFDYSSAAKVMWNEANGE
jgi:hypothetical protein